MTDNPFTRLSVTSMKLQGLWPVSFFGKKTAILHRSFGVFNAICYALFTASMFVDVIISRNNLEAIVANLCITLLYFSGTAKALSFLFMRETIGKLVEHATDFTRKVRKAGNQRCLKIIDEYVRRSNTITLGFWLMVLLTVTSYCGAPIIGVVAGSKAEPTRLIYRAWNPFPNLWSGYVLQLTMAYLTAVITATWDTLVVSLVMIPTCELKTLGVELEEIPKCALPNGKEENEGVREIEIKKRVSNWVKQHSAVMRYIETLDRILNHLMLLNFVVYSGIFCTTCFQYVINGFKFESFVAFQYMIATMCQMMFSYWEGNEIRIHSEALAHAAFNSAWYDAPASLKTTVLIIILRCQKPLRLRVWKLYDISMSSCLKIMSTTYSYFAILWHVYSKK
ncbi:odorant receptor 30a-like [Athalia rosae]|uniref:odorant receptor 30a-like n=1 Tax=Athalia rosae TaxID=37344 RepID=UPI002033DB19|nr:odorant receptor 30a-like [Athalia rosae]